jgi:hypothetical protein
MKVQRYYPAFPLQGILRSSNPSLLNMPSDAIPNLITRCGMKSEDFCRQHRSLPPGSVRHRRKRPDASSGSRCPWKYVPARIYAIRTFRHVRTVGITHPGCIWIRSKLPSREMFDDEIHADDHSEKKKRWSQNPGSSREGSASFIPRGPNPFACFQGASLFGATAGWLVRLPLRPAKICPHNLLNFAP